MSTFIFSHARSTSEESLWMNDDGMLTHSSSNDGWALVRQGPIDSERRLTVAEAKDRWPEHAEKIEKAFRNITKPQT